jgi:hypothetical protein
VIAFGLSLLANATLLTTFGLVALESARLRQQFRPASPPPAQSVVLIFPEVTESDTTPAAQAPSLTPILPPPSAAANRFARTAGDQSAPRPQHPVFIGERDTQATSDRAPNPSAPPLPSQAGIAPRSAMEIETTESDYQDGSLTSGQNASPAADTPPTPPAPNSPTPRVPTPVTTANALEESDLAAVAPVPNPPPPREPLLDGPNPVDVQIPHEDAKTHETPPTPENLQPADTPPRKPAQTPKAAEAPRPTPSRTPGFKGFQRKTAIVGSISRTGRSALDVEDSALGRYQAALSRAVELEWQRNCVRHRDYITPGFLTVRFFVEPRGKVRSVQFVGDMETGEVQKGFTLNAIRDAAIPAMPPALRKEYDQEPLELIFRFYF